MCPAGQSQEVGRFLVGASLLLFSAPHPPLVSVSHARRQPDWDATGLCANDIGSLASISRTRVLRTRSTLSAALFRDSIGWAPVSVRSRNLLIGLLKEAAAQGKLRLRPERLQIDRANGDRGMGVHALRWVDHDNAQYRILVRQV